ncbi:hypothetical protein PIB30_053092 [Stylosanthes scabra]|uniref:Uncharacterized protein n=1 Tax=Stylosanthes scabra TaxID=79078 RepID=A0ABU6RJ32_9FABA|nr:hypothetical protein [Stylosanthes scabra]
MIPSCFQKKGNSELNLFVTPRTALSNGAVAGELNISSSTISTFTWQPRRHFQVLLQERKEFWETQRRLEAQLAIVIELVTRLVTLSAASTSITSQPLKSGDLPSQALSIPRRSIPTMFLCANQEGREDAPLNEGDVENLNHEEVRECLEEVEEKNEDQEAEDVDHEVEDKDKEQKGMEILQSASSEVTPSELPSELQFEWVNFSNLNSISPQHYGLLETDGQLKAL